MRVLVLERGRRWEPPAVLRGSPATPGSSATTIRPCYNGWLDMRFYRGHDGGAGRRRRRRIADLQQRGRGGRIRTSSRKGWPAEITHAGAEALLRHGCAGDGPAGDSRRPARRGASSSPATPREEPWLRAIDSRRRRCPSASRRTGTTSSRIRSIPKHSRQFTNAHGQRQGTCIHLGNCDIGCDVRAKNGLDVNYIPRAEQKGAEVRPLHLVRLHRARAGATYRVVFDRIEQRPPDSRRGDRRRASSSPPGVSARTELLLRCRDQYRTLPAISPHARRALERQRELHLDGRLCSDEEHVKQSTGPTISSILDFADGGFGNQRFVIEDDGFPNAAAQRDQGLAGQRHEHALRAASPQRARRASARRHAASATCCSGSGAGMDAARRHAARSKRRWFMPWKRVLEPGVGVEQSEGVLKAMEAMHQSLTEATGGRPRALPTWSLLQEPADAAPARRLRDRHVRRTNGVVDHLGRVVRLSRT